MERPLGVHPAVVATLTAGRRFGSMPAGKDDSGGGSFWPGTKYPATSPRDFAWGEWSSDCS